MRKRATTGTVAGCCLMWFASAGLVAAGGIDLSKLPPPATNHIDFTRDVRPILENSCIRCHGPEKPKSHFRLDNREDALKGGEKGVDIVAGDSGKSPLIHYITYLVEDMEMPPMGKGDQLTPEQVGKLRAWIDQGVVWDNQLATNTPVSYLTFLAGGTGLSGDNHKYREHYSQREGANGGLEKFELFDDSSIPGTKVIITGHVLLDDYKISLTADRNEVGFIHSGWEQYRTYFDDTGGYHPAPSTLTAPSLGEDLHLDIGKAWIDFGLTLPDWPQMTLGYEYDYKTGNEATTSWGSDGTGANVRSIAPTSKNILEDTQIIKFDLDSDVKGVTIEERFRGEFYRLNTAYTNDASRGPVAANTSESDHYFQGANTLRLEKQVTGWLFASGGYLYSKLDSSATFNNTSVFNGLLTFVSAVPQITLERESHVFNLNGLLGPFEGLTISTGVQSEWTRQNGFGSGTLNSIAYTLTAPATLAVNPATLASAYDQNSTMETVALRYTKIPFTVLFAELRLQQETIGESDSDLQASGNYIDNPSSSSQMTDARVGFSTSPWRSVSLSAHYRRYENDSSYQPDQNVQPVGGYPGFLRSRDLLTDEVEAKLAWHPFSWLKNTLSYQYLTTRYHSDTEPAFNATPLVISPGGSLLAGETVSQIYSIDSMWMPATRWYFDAMFSFQPSRTTTATAGSPSIVPYEGNTYSVIANGTYVLDQASDLFAGYAFSKAGYGQNNSAAGVPLGIDYQMHAAQVGLSHRFNKDISAKLQYRFNYYEEPSSGGANNYRAHTVFASLTFRLR
jgi:hypothetical protein